MPATRDWPGLGLAVQAYGKRALGRHRLGGGDSRARCGRRMTVRLVKGAYWDSEIKRARSAASTAIRCTRARSPPMCPIWPARAGCSGTPT